MPIDGPYGKVSRTDELRQRRQDQAEAAMQHQRNPHDRIDDLVRENQSLREEMKALRQWVQSLKGDGSGVEVAWPLISFKKTLHVDVKHVCTGNGTSVFDINVT